MRVFAIILISLFYQLINAQQYKFNPTQTKEIVINYSDSIAIINVLILKKEIKIKDDVNYYWYYSNTVNRNLGGYQGNLLHGEYSLLLKNNHLIAKGNFEKGLKVDCWKYWYDNGNLKEIQNWKDGKLDGDNIIYDKNGKKIIEASYKNGVLNGKYYIYKDNKIVEKKLRNGTERSSKKKANETRVDTLESSIKTTQNDQKHLGFFNKLFKRKEHEIVTDSIKKQNAGKDKKSDEKVVEISAKKAGVKPNEKSGLKSKGVGKDKDQPKKKDENKSNTGKKSEVKEVDIKANKTETKKDQTRFWNKIFKKKEKNDNVKAPEKIQKPAK